MPAIAPLSTGVIERIMRGEEVNKPVLQILGTKKITGGETDRLRLLISDGKFINSYSMLATQLNHLHAEGKLAEYTIVQVDKYITSVVNGKDTGKRVLIILELSVLNPGTEVGKKIGTPVSYTDDAGAAQIGKPNSTGGSTTASRPNAQMNAPKNEVKPSVYSNNNTSLNASINSGLTNPISMLSPYQNKWVIKARVTSKGPMRSWSNAKGEGKLFSMDLMDESGEIRATAFREQAEKFYDLIEVDHVYFISKCQLKPANKQFSNLKNDYEMTMTAETVIQACEEDDSDIPEIKYDLVPISQVANLEPRTSVDTIGICKDVGELQSFTSRTTNKEFKKRELTLVDSSNAAMHFRIWVNTNSRCFLYNKLGTYEAENRVNLKMKANDEIKGKVSLTLWGDEAVNFDGYVQPVILVKGARVSEFNGGKSLSMGNGAVMKINPDIPEGHKLRGWFDNGGGEHISNMISARTGGAGGGFNTEWLTFIEARDRNLGAGDKPDYFQCKAVVHIVKNQNAFYKACPQPECNKKVIDENNGHYRCERCNSVFPNFKYRLLINMSIGDWTSNRWVTCFSEVGEQMLKKSANEIGELLENNPPEGEELLSSINFNTYIFKLRSKMEMFGDMQKNKLTVQSVAPLDYKEYNKYLINNLKELTGIGKN